MTCQGYEQLLAADVRTQAVEAHLEACSHCRAFNADLEDNSQALLAMREDVIPVRQKPVRQKWEPRWLWAAAAAALVVGSAMSLFHPREAPPTAPTPVPVASAPAPAMPALPAIRQTTAALPQTPPSRTPARAVRAPEPPTEELFVQILTPDPDVVIYWLIESKEGIL